ncbi:MAG: EAL domain-containing protein [Hyphomonadaceae bacterium]|nr:EAL domain-containing protein [Hyphomonadaceae bacterium]
MNQRTGTLWKRYGTALILILAVLTTSHFIESHAIRKAQADAEVINLSAKQRMLSQKIVLHAQAFIIDNEPEDERQLSDTVDEFERAHQNLMQDAAREESLGGLYLARTPSTDEIVVNFVSIARAIPTSPYPEALFDELEFKGTGIVLERLDEAVVAYDARAQKQAQWVHRLQEITLLIAAAVIILEALFIFLPAQRLVRRGFEKLRAMAETDPLTRLRNRAGFERDMAEAMSDRDHEVQSVTLVLLDLDDFKGINDRHGHITGDAVLKTIGERLARLPNLVSTARVGGDEFALLVDNSNWENSFSPDGITADVRECMDYVYRPIEHNGLVIDVSGSVGVSRYPHDAANLIDLRRNASAALLDAKKSGRASISIYDSRIDEIVRQKRIIQSALLSGEYEQNLSVCFQPIVELSSQTIKSVEVLARWQHSELGSLNPELFLAIARECGLGDKIETRIRALALEQMAPSLNAGSVESISINISPVDLATQGFANALFEQFATYNVNTAQVWIEVTETERLTSRATVRENLEALSAAGVRIALDDYGVGYSNIQRLAELPIQRVKIDKSIVWNIEQDRKYAGVFRSSIQLARALGADVVAEGVETPGQLTEAMRQGCKFVQGYLFFKPLPAAECIPHLGQRLSAAA